MLCFVYFVLVTEHWLKVILFFSLIMISSGQPLGKIVRVFLVLARRRLFWSYGAVVNKMPVFAFLLSRGRELLVRFLPRSKEQPLCLRDQKSSSYFLQVL